MCNRVLIVEDNDSSAALFARIVTKYFNFEVDIARTVEEALLLINQIQYCLVISDISLPIRSGHEIVNRCIDGDIPVIVVTAYMPNMVFVDKRVKGCFYKPIDISLFKETIKNVVKKQDLKEIEYA